MRNVTKAALAGLVIAAGLGMGGTAQAADAFSSTIRVTNNTKKSVWVTFYSVFKQQLGTRCVKANSFEDRNFGGGEIKSFGGVYIRYEHKQDSNCGGKTLHDSHYGGLYQMPGYDKTLTVYVPSI